MDRIVPNGVWDALEAVFPPPASLAVTEGGLWLATPVRVLGAALDVLRTAGLAQDRARILDAGSGDGRLLGVFAALGSGWELDLLGIEVDAGLVATGHERLAALRRAGHLGAARIRLVSGDYLSAATYERLGQGVAGIDCLFNYPDGNEGRIEDLVARSGGPRSRLVLLGPDRHLRLHQLETDWAADIPRAAEPPWRMVVSRPGSRRGSTGS